MPDFPTWLTFAGVVLTAFLGYWGIRFTAQSSRKAQREAEERTTALERSKVDAQAYERARENYDSALKTMQGQIDALKTGREYDREEHTRQMNELRERLRELEDARRVDRATIATLAAYARVLLGILRDNQLTYPPPPQHLTEH